MSDQTIGILTLLWFAIIVTGGLFTSLNWRRARSALLLAVVRQENRKIMLLVRAQDRAEANSFITFALLFVMGVVVPIRQKGVIGHDLFNQVFYGALIAAAAAFTIRAIMRWNDLRRLDDMDDESPNTEKES